MRNLVGVARIFDLQSPLMLASRYSGLIEPILSIYLFVRRETGLPLFLWRPTHN